jgi:hypothetical protein
LHQASCGCLLGVMPGASEQTQRVKIINANWAAGPDGDHGRFEVMIVTEDGKQHVIAPSPESMTALIALTQADTVLAWDPAGRTMIAANLVGRMPWTFGERQCQLALGCHDQQNPTTAFSTDRR